MGKRAASAAVRPTVSILDDPVGMSRRDMKVGPIETNMVGIDRKALGQIFEDFL